MRNTATKEQYVNLWPDKIFERYFSRSAVVSALFILSWKCILAVKIRSIFVPDRTSYISSGLSGKYL